MKKIPILLAVLAIPLLAYAASFQFGQYIILNSSTTAPVPLTNITLNVRSLTIIGKKGFQTTNTSTVFVGFTSANGEQCVSIDPGGSAVLLDSGRTRTLSVSNVWLDVTTANDGVLVIYD